MKYVYTLLGILLMLGLSVPVMAESAGHAYFGQQPGMYQSKTDYGNNLAAGAYVQSGDAKIYYEVYGKGSPVVLLHGGIVGNPAEMGELADHLRPNHQVILISTRGHGRSEIGTVLPTYQQKAADVHAVLRKLAIPQADVIGFSDGAYTAYFLGAAYPQDVRRLVAIGAGVWPKGFVQGGRKAMHAFRDVRDMDTAYWQNQLKNVRPEPDRVNEWFDQTGAAYDQTVVDDAFLKTITAPTLVMSGERDENAPLDTVIKAYRAIPQGELAIIPGAPHPVLLTDFNIVWPMISQFIERV